MTISHFKVFGYYLEYWVGGKMIGTTKHETQLGQEFGYYSRKNAVADKQILLEKNKKIPAGVEYFTMEYPLCGKSKLITL
jgi:hypothetical protein